MVPVVNSPVLSAIAGNTLVVHPAKESPKMLYNIGLLRSGLRLSSTTALPIALQRHNDKQRGSGSLRVPTTLLHCNHIRYRYLLRNLARKHDIRCSHFDARYSWKKSMSGDDLSRVRSGAFRDPGQESRTPGPPPTPLLWRPDSTFECLPYIRFLRKTAAYHASI